jgi:hypothetical protein
MFRPAPSPATSTTSCNPVSVGHHQRPAGHVGVLVEFLASADPLQRSRSAGRPDPVAFFLVRACGRRSDDRRRAPAPHATSASWSSHWPVLAGLVTLHAAQPLRLVELVSTDTGESVKIMVGIPLQGDCIPASAGHHQHPAGHFQAGRVPDMPDIAANR